MRITIDDVLYFVRESEFINPVQQRVILNRLDASPTRKEIDKARREISGKNRRSIAKKVRGFFTGPVGPIGEAGQPGVPGPSGASVYDIWLANGNSGSVEDFLRSLRATNGGGVR